MSSAVVIKAKIFILILFIIVIQSCKPSSSSQRNTEDSLTWKETLVIGQKYYHLRGCIKCHGRTGKGDGYRVQSYPLELLPRDFKAVASYKQGSDFKSIVFTIRNGITNQPPVTRRGLMSLFSTNKTSSSGMPSYPHLTDEEIIYIANYVLYLQTNQN